MPPLEDRCETDVLDDASWREAMAVKGPSNARYTLRRANLHAEGVDSIPAHVAGDVPKSNKDAKRDDRKRWLLEQDGAGGHRPRDVKARNSPVESVSIFGIGGGDDVAAVVPQDSGAGDNQREPQREGHGVQGIDLNHLKRN